jgi:hypothetical protein
LLRDVARYRDDAVEFTIDLSRHTQLRLDPDLALLAVACAKADAYIFGIASPQGGDRLLRNSPERRKIPRTSYLSLKYRPKMSASTHNVAASPVALRNPTASLDLICWRLERFE